MCILINIAVCQDIFTSMEIFSCHGNTLLSLIKTVASVFCKFHMIAIKYNIFASLLSRFIVVVMVTSFIKLYQCMHFINRNRFLV